MHSLNGNTDRCKTIIIIKWKYSIPLVSMSVSAH